MKEKFCKGNIFISPFLTGPDMRYKRGHCGILPKNCRVVPSPLDTQAAPCDMWHRSFHLGISHSEFYSADIPSGQKFSLIPLGCLTAAIIFGRRSTSSRYLISGSGRHLLRIFHIRRLPSDGRGGRFNFHGQTCSDTLVTLTRTAWLIRHSRFAESISAHNKKALTILTTKSPKLSLIFNARYIRQDIPKSSQVS